MAKTNKPTNALRLQVLSEQLDHEYLLHQRNAAEHRAEFERTGNHLSQIMADYAEGMAHGIRRAAVLVQQTMGVK